MSKRSFQQRLRKSQLSRRLSALLGLANIGVPGGGWIRATREALGMSGRQLARRMGVSPPTLAQFEAGEAAGSITLRTLTRAAEALDCNLVYAFLPRKGSLDAAIQGQAERRARTLVERVSHSMALEDQGVDESFTEDQIDRLAADLVRDARRDLWESDSEDRVPTGGNTANTGGS